MTTILKLQRANHGNYFRAYGLRGAAKQIDPFIGVDHAWMSGPTFPPHPHAGFSAVSYLFLDSETDIANRDSTGSNNLIKPGGLHWATAGSCIVHEEVPAETGKTVHSLQIFINLADADHNISPSTLSLEPQDIPVVQKAGVKVRVPLGSFGEVHSPLKPPTQVTMLDISLDDGSSQDVTIPQGHSAFVMPIYGAVQINEKVFSLDDLELPVYPAINQEQTLSLKAAQGSAKAVLFSGQPFYALPT